jgi:hypothetical protein
VHARTPEQTLAALVCSTCSLREMCQQVGVNPPGATPSVGDLGRAPSLG